MSGGMSINGANVPQVPYPNGPLNGHQSYHDQVNNIQPQHNGNNNHHIDDNEDPDDVGHYSLVLAIEYKYYEKFIDCLDAIEHWLYMIASQIRYLLALNKVFKCDQMENSLKLNTDINALHNLDGDTLNDSINNNNNNSYDNSMIDDEDCPDRLHTIIPFMTNIAPTAVFKFDQLFSATFVNHHFDGGGASSSGSGCSSSASCTTSPLCIAAQNEDMPSMSMSSSYLIQDPRYGMIYNMNYIPSRGLPARISLFNTWFTNSLDNRDKHKLSTMISSHLQTLGRTVIIGDDEAEIDRYISTLALFSTQQQKSLSRLSVKVDDPSNLSSHYIPELYLQGIVIPQIKAQENNKNNNNNNNNHNNNGNNINNINIHGSLLNNSPSNNEFYSPQQQQVQSQKNNNNNNNNNNELDAWIAKQTLDYQATITYLQSSSAIKQLQEDLYLAPGPSTLVLLTSSKHINDDNNNNNEDDQKQSFWWIRQTAMPHKFKQEQQNLLFQKLFYLRRRRRRNSSSYIYARKRSGQLFDSSPSRRMNNSYNNNNNNNNNNNINPHLTPPNYSYNITNEKLSSSPPTESAKNRVTKAHQRTLERKKRQQQELMSNGLHSKEFFKMNKIYQKSKTLTENEECNNNNNGQQQETIDSVLEYDDDESDNDNESVTATSQHSVVTNTTINSGTTINTHLSSSIPQPIHAPHFHQTENNKNLTFVEPSLSPMIATIVFGSFNIPQELKMTFLETQFRILLEKASEILLYIEHEQKDLLSFYDKTCHVMSCKEFKEQVPMEALYPQIMQKFESQLRSDLQISRQEDLYVLLSISEGFRPNLFSLMFGNPVFDIEVADILRYFLF